MAAALFILLLATPAAVFAVDYTVGGNVGWSQGVDYTSWVSGKTFSVGDVLVFTYGGTHSVDVVSKSDYDNCATSNPLESFNGGNTRINLTTPGVMYFTCPTAGHCSSGMKLAVTVTATPSTPSGTPPTTPSGTPPSGSETPSTTTSPPPPPSGNGAASSLCNTNNLMFVTISAVLGVVFAFMG
ncbi:hypothetical protein Dsin_026522 [Dipteronia sinensis]|uniref:Phytocyanin domain-containing protein n=1 Tax=Dipteronia sinensis TaxID=43782 RepID=A0AAE0DXY7_9ROSI|nr:hypothetical protein Dsin_026522 [Dipteronia sinensis]